MHEDFKNFKNYCERNNKKQSEDLVLINYLDHVNKVGACCDKCTSCYRNGVTHERK